MRAAVLGYGTIGSGVVEIVWNKAKKLEAEIGEPLEIAYVLDLRDFPGNPVEEVLTHDFQEIVNDPTVDMVVEVMGGLKPAYDFVKASLLAGKSVITSNKALVAEYGTELFKIAREKNVHFLFEASCGGAIPIIRPLYSAMTGTDIVEITGILNGTTNFMLTKMGKENKEYAEALKEAQDLGYAERNPSADVEGFDACRKIAILGSVALRKQIRYQDIPTRGITDITKADLSLADRLGYAIRLVGSLKAGEKGVSVQVTPALVDSSHPLYSVNGVLNAILVRGDMSSDLMFYGSGAGKLPTASAVVADMVEAAKNKGRLVFTGWTEENVPVMTTEEQHRWFVRCGAVSSEEADQMMKAFDSEEMLETEEGTAFISGPMVKEELEKKKAAFTGIHQVIPVMK